MLSIQSSFIDSVCAHVCVCVCVWEGGKVVGSIPNVESKRGQKAL